jgi:hypothetical protein
VTENSVHRAIQCLTILRIIIFHWIVEGIPQKHHSHAWNRQVVIWDIQNAGLTVMKILSALLFNAKFNYCRDTVLDNWEATDSFLQPFLVLPWLITEHQYHPWIQTAEPCLSPAFADWESLVFRGWHPEPGLRLGDYLSLVLISPFWDSLQPTACGVDQMSWGSGSGVAKLFQRNGWEDRSLWLIQFFHRITWNWASRRMLMG